MNEISDSRSWPEDVLRVIEQALKERDQALDRERITKSAFRENQEIDKRIREAHEQLYKDYMVYRRALHDIRLISNADLVPHTRSFYKNTLSTINNIADGALEET